MAAPLVLVARWRSDSQPWYVLSVARRNTVFLDQCLEGMPGLQLPRFTAGLLRFLPIGNMEVGTLLNSVKRHVVTLACYRVAPQL